MKSTEDKESQLNTEIYDFNVSTKKLLTLIIFFFSLGLYLNFTIGDFIESKIRSITAQNVPCPFNFKEVNWGLIPLPSASLSNLEIDKACISPSLRGVLSLDKIIVSFRGISFSPLGPRIKLSIQKKDKTLIETTLAFSTNKQKIEVQEEKMDFSFIMESLDLPISMNGQGKVEFNIVQKFKNNTIEKGNLRVLSNNFQAPSNNINGLIVPPLKIGLINIQSKIDKKNNLKIEKLQIGSKNATVHIDLAGAIKLNTKNIAFSQLDLKGKLYFSKKFLESFAIIKLFFNSIKQEEEYYHIHLSGSLMSPKIANYANIKK